MKKLKISIITATYNSEVYLDSAIKSLLSQSFNDYEYLIIDGGSIDGTVDIIKHYEPLFDGRLRWISEPDKGMYDALNKGIHLATGDVVGILNSDDFFPSNDVLEKINNEFVSDASIEAIYGDVGFVTPENTDKIVRYYSSRVWRPWMFRFGFMPAHPSFYTYRHNFNKYGFYREDFKIAADFEFLVRHLYKAPCTAKYIPMEFVRMRTGGMSTRGWSSFWTLTKEDTRACRENGIWTCVPIVFLRFVIKVILKLFTRLSYDD